ncbi:MAG: hypothetical protein AAGA00_01030 [Pseudomonadota bacterium]
MSGGSLPEGGSPLNLFLDADQYHLLSLKFWNLAAAVLGIRQELQPVFGARAAQPMSDHYRPDNQRKSGRPAVISVGQAYLLIERRLY